MERNSQFDIKRKNLKLQKDKKLNLNSQSIKEFSF